MKINANRFMNVMLEYDFLSFPRTVGNPYQKPVFNPLGFWTFVKTNNAQKICFTSHNSYPEWDGCGDPQEVRIGKLFFDFDHNTKLENPYRDLKRLATFFDKEDIPWASTFSGSKGFHCYAFLKRENYPINNETWAKTMAIHSFIRAKGKPKREWLKTLDGKVAEPKRLCRVPFTRHVGMKDEGEYKINDKYCIPLQRKDLNKELEDILYLSQHPEIKKNYKTDGMMLTLDQFINHFDIDIEEWATMNGGQMEDGFQFIADYDGVPDDSFAVYVSKIIPRMCIHQDLFSDNPTHFSRMMTVIFLKQADWEYEDIVKLFNQMAIKFKWADGRNVKRRNYQIKQIYFKRTSVGGYWHASCSKIKNKNLCVGNKCPEWFDTEK